MNLGPIFYPIFYGGHSGPISEEGQVTLFGIFIILNLAFVLTIAIKTIIYLRADKTKRDSWLDNTYWGYLFYESSLLSGMVIITGMLLDGIVLLCLIGQEVGKAIL